MFLESVKVIETTPCLAEKELFKVVARASVNLNEILPYLNNVLEKPNYQITPQSLVFKSGKSNVTLKDDKISITKVVNITQAYEIIDWIKEIINDTFESITEIEPNYTPTKQVGVLKIYSLLPKTNCKLCGEQSCMAFAGKLSKIDANIDECPALKEPDLSKMRELLS